MTDIVPEWLLQGPAKASAVGSSAPIDLTWVSRTLASPEDVRPGTQEETLSRLCWYAARHWPEDIAEAILGRWLLALPLGNPQDPWTFDHLEEKLGRAYEKAEPAPGMAGPVYSSHPGCPQYTPLRGGGGQVGNVSGRWPATQEVYETPPCMHFPDQDWIVEDFVSPGNLTEIIGKVKKGKSTLAYQLIRSVTTGEPFLGRVVSRTPVVLLSEQTGTSLKKTLERAGLLESSDVHVLTKVRSRVFPTWEALIRSAIWRCLEVGARVLVVDTLSRFAGLLGDSENSASAVTILNVFEEAKALGIGCVFIRHARKGKPGFDDDGSDLARGSTAITGEMDVVVRLKPHPDSNLDLRILTWDSRLSDDPEPICLEYQGGKYVIVDAPPSAAEKNELDRVEAVRAALLKLGQDASARDVAKETGFSPTTASKYLKALKNGASAGPVEE